MQFQISLALFSSSVILLVLCDDEIFYPVDDTKYAGSPCETGTGLRGICRRASECRDSAEKLAYGDLCSFDRSEGVYCCPLDFIINTDVRFDATDNSTSSPSSSVNVVKNASSEPSVESRPVEQICNRFYPEQQQKNRISEKDLSLVEQQRPLFMTSIGWTNQKTETISWKCTGVLIAERIILTDANCIKSTSDSPSVARLEILRPNKNRSRSHKIVNITSIYTHPDFKLSELYHNLAIVKLDTDQSLVKNIKPACLSTTTGDISTGDLLRWGFSNHTMGTTFSRNVTLLNNDLCSKKIGNDFAFAKNMGEAVFCGDLKEICQEDAGGPVLHQHTTGSGGASKPFIVGITSFGSYCANTLNPIVYTRLSSYLDWIEPFLSRESLIQ